VRSRWELKSGPSALKGLRMTTERGMFRWKNKIQSS
jgi:hypothetical protein